MKRYLNYSQTLWIMSSVLIFMSFGFGLIYSSFSLLLIHQFHFSHELTFSLYNTYVSWFFTASIFGGFLGGRLGHRECVWIGSVLLCSAYLCFCFESTLYLACALMDVGMGLFFPNAMVVIGHARAPQQKQSLTLGYILLYLSVNVGVFIGGIIFGSIGIQHFAILFLIAGFCALVSGLIYTLAFPFISFLSNSQSALQSMTLGKYKNIDLKSCALLILMSFFAVLILEFILKREALSNILVIVLTVLTFGFLLFLGFFKNFGLESRERRKLNWFIVIILATLIFWALYNLEQSLVLGFFDSLVNRDFLGFLIPSSFLGSFNALCDILVGILFMTKMKKLNDFFSSQSRAFFAIFLMGLSYLVLALGTYLSISQGEVPILWIFLAFIMMSISEMMIGPLSNSLAIEYGPPVLQGFLIGCGQLISGVAGSLSDYLAKIGTFDDHMATEYILKHLSRAFFIDSILGVLVGLFLLVGCGIFKHYSKSSEN